MTAGKTKLVSAINSAAVRCRVSLVAKPEVGTPHPNAEQSAIYASSGLLATNPPLFPGRLQLPIPLGMDLPLTPGEHVLRSDVADGTVQPDVIVMLDVALYQTPRIVQRQRRSRPDALSFERFVPTLDFSVRLGIVGRSSDMGAAPRSE